MLTAMTAPASSTPSDMVSSRRPRRLLRWGPGIPGGAITVELFMGRCLLRCGQRQLRLRRLARAVLVRAPGRNCRLAAAPRAVEKPDPDRHEADGEDDPGPRDHHGVGPVMGNGDHENDD